MRAQPGSVPARWLVVVGLVAAIYALVPVALPLWQALQRLAGPFADALGVIGLLLGAALVAGRAAQRTIRITPAGWLALGGTVLGYALTLGLVPLTAAEKTHFLSYGLLAWAAHRALRLHLGPWPTAVGAVALVGLAGLGDELIQGVLPNRYFEWKDVGLNAVSGLLAVVPVGLLNDERPADHADLPSSHR